MPEVKLDDVFARFEASAAPTFRPRPLPELAARATKRRRLRRGLLGGLLSVFVAGPAGAFAVASAGGDPAPRPSPTVTVTPAMDGVRRQVRVEGQAPTHYAHLWFGQNAREIWAFIDSCDTTERTPDCRYLLAFSSDIGVSWRNIALPEGIGQHGIEFHPVDAQYIVLEAIGVGLWETTDGGVTWSQKPENSPSLQALRQAAASLNDAPDGDFHLYCPGRDLFLEAVGPEECARQDLIRTGQGPVDPQPTLPGTLDQVQRGGDGRLWLTARNADSTETRLAVSTDDARTWTEVTRVPDEATLTVSPDGRDVFLVGSGDDRVWQIPDDGAEPTSVRRTEDRGAEVVKAIGDGALAWGTTEGIWLYRGDEAQQVSAMNPHHVQVLADGTVAVGGNIGREEGDRWLVGTGSGADREWVVLEAND